MSISPEKKHHTTISGITKSMMKKALVAEFSEENIVRLRIKKGEFVAIISKEVPEKGRIDFFNKWKKWCKIRFKLVEDDHLKYDD
ncbi:hypothetical protein JYU20_00590 [Bacteroidales bacterium AH-315-I05]|nr:hypothetical protein [Bacteroidales bacterium AH-315-I05]